MPAVAMAVRWIAVFVGATAGSWAGRIAAAALYGEPVDPLLRLNARTLLEQDIAPGFLVAELLGRPLRLGPAGEAVLAAASAAASALATGPYVGKIEDRDDT
jgi:hypothetical protein